MTLKQQEPAMNTVATSAKAPADRRTWYHLSAAPAIVLAVMMLLLLGLNVVPRRIDRLNEVYPGADIKPVVKEFGFPQTAVSTVSTEFTNSVLDGVFQQRPSAVTIEYVLCRTKLKWSADTNVMSFNISSQTWNTQGCIGINVE